LDVRNILLGSHAEHCWRCSYHHQQQLIDG
jgi:hypothetical protein